MNISKKSEYGIKALIKLAINYENGVQVTLINDIAQCEKIPQKYLEQILLGLKNNGILVSKRGASGGYSLAKPPEKITLGDILRVGEGSLAQRKSSRSSETTDPVTAGVEEILSGVDEQIRSIVDQISLKTMVNKAKELIEKKRTTHNYVI